MSTVDEEHKAARKIKLYFDKKHHCYEASVYKDTFQQHFMFQVVFDIAGDTIGECVEWLIKQFPNVNEINVDPRM